MVLAIGLTAAGCGGGDGGGATAAGGGKADFVSRANAACAKASSGLMDRVRAFEKRSAEAGASPEPYVDAVHFVFLPSVEMQVFRIEQLKPPVGEKARIDALLDTSRTAIDRVATVPRVPSIEVARRYFVEADKLFRAYGLPACANGPKREGV